MTLPRNRRHIVVPDSPKVERYRPHPLRIPPRELPIPSSRPAHGAALKQSIQNATHEALKRRETAFAAGLSVHGAAPGTYIEFESQPDVPLNLTGLEDLRAGIELVAFTERETNEPEPRKIQRAEVFVPDGQVKHFIKRFESYAKTSPRQKRERRYEKTLDPVAALRRATLRSLWTDNDDAYPGDDETAWWEVWLRRHDGGELSRLMEFAAAQGLDVAERRLQFHDRIVTLVRATPAQLSVSIDVLNDVAEVQRAKETSAVFVDMGPEEQAEWVKDLLNRTTGPDTSSPAVCILDTGIARGHPLLEAATDAEDCTAVDITWGAGDDSGHGTQMAGLALYGDLANVLAASTTVRLDHRLESVKILPPKGANPPELYGAITAEAASRAEVQAPRRKRCFMMAVTAEDERDQGQPTSWSSAVDALAAGRVFDPSTQGLVYLDAGDRGLERRLFILSVGNVEGANLSANHLDRSDVEPVHDPAQAWNALTVGAFTNRIAIRSDDWRGHDPVAEAGDLSPWSTTSVTFAAEWPVKPDVVYEGGNVVKNGRGEVDFPCPDLCLLSTHYRPSEKSFVACDGTSAATAQVARMAATIESQYPTLWPESVRGLIVHSAKWTPAMKSHLKGSDGKRARERLMRRYGYGVPELPRALRSAGDSLTLIAQGIISPFAPKGDDTRTRQMGEMHLFELPWPTDVLEGLAEQPVSLRVTISYFIEPNPGRRGRTKRHRYASHGLRFDVKGATESVDDFRKRLNQQALDEDEEKPTASASDSWYFGKKARNRGSVHSDILSDLAANLAYRGVIGIYPVSGWWKDQPKRDRSDRGTRYSLIVSIDTQATDIDLWTPVATKVGLPIVTEIGV